MMAPCMIDLCLQREHLLDSNGMPEKEIETMHIACLSQNNRHHLRQSGKSQLIYFFTIIASVVFVNTFLYSWKRCYNLKRVCLFIINPFYILSGFLYNSSDTINVGCS